MNEHNNEQVAQRRFPPDEDARTEEGACQECGARNPIWFATHPAWNLAVGGDAAREAGGILCPSCFHRRWLAATGGAQKGQPFIVDEELRHAISRLPWHGEQSRAEEPSDAQVDAAQLALAHSGHSVYSKEGMRAALRAAGGVS